MEESSTKHSFETLIVEVDLNDPRVAAHFPGKPIIAAYMQMEWLERLCAQVDYPISGINNVKFLSQITPPCSVMLRLNRDSGAFSIEVSGDVKTKGRVVC